MTPHHSLHPTPHTRPTPGPLSTTDLLLLTSLDQPLVILQTLFTFFYKTRYLNEEVNCTEPSPLVSIPWFVICLWMCPTRELSYPQTVLPVNGPTRKRSYPWTVLSVNGPTRERSYPWTVLPANVPTLFLYLRLSDILLEKKSGFSNIFCVPRRVISWQICSTVWMDGSFN